MLGCWIEAMRLRTLPVSVAGVLTAFAFGLRNGNFDAVPAVICLLFAVMAQVASNFANEYYDYKEGRDRPGREGPRRGVTEGEISPGAMKLAVFVTLGVACCLGLSLVAWGGWWLIGAGAFIALGVFAYSAGPYPLSTHGLGEVAVVFFFGIVPVNLTYYVQTLAWDTDVALASVVMGLMGANVLIVNNYRDVEDDRAVGKNTLAVKFGRRAMRLLYLCNAFVAGLCLCFAGWGVAVPAAYFSVSVLICFLMGRREGARLTPLLGGTAVAMLAVAVAMLAVATAG